MRFCKKSICFFAFVLATGCVGSVKIKKVNEPVQARSVTADPKADHEAATAAVTKKNEFPDYEKLTFRVKWAGVPIGTLTAVVQSDKTPEGREVYRIETNLNSNGIFAVIFRIADRFVSYIDKESLCSVRHEVYGGHGNRRRATTTTFDQLEHRAHFMNLLNASGKTFTIPVNAQDLLGSFYHLQLLSLTPGDRVDYDVFNIERYYRLTYSVIGKALISLPNASREQQEALVVEPVAYSREDGRITRGTIRLYISSRPRGIPLYAEIDGVMLAKVTFTLRSIERK